MIDEEPWFVSADACRILTLKSHASNGSYTGYVHRLESSERRIITASELPTTPSGRDGREQSVVSESALYKLILRSDTEVAIPSKLGDTGSPAERSEHRRQTMP